MSLQGLTDRQKLQQRKLGALGNEQPFRGIRELLRSAIYSGDSKKVLLFIRCAVKDGWKTEVEEALSEAEATAELEKFHSEIPKLREAIKTMPSPTPSEHFAIAKEKRKRMQSSESLSHINKALKVEADNDTYLAFKSKLLRDMYLPINSMSLVASRIRERPSDEYLKSILSDCYRGIGCTEQAKRMLQGCSGEESKKSLSDLSLDSLSVDALTRKATAAVASNNYLRAIDIYSTLKEKNPSLLHVYLANQSLCFTKSGSYHKGLLDALEVCRSHPNFARGFERKALALQHLNQHEAALEAVNVALQLTPHSSVSALLKQQLEKQILEKSEGVEI